MNLSFIDSLPSTCTEIDSLLRDRGFECKEEVTCDPDRWRIYYREFKNEWSNALIRVVLRFELSISDSPTATYDENHHLYFDDAFLEIWDRQMLSEESSMGGLLFDEESETLRKISDYPLTVSTFEDIERLCGILR